MSDEGLALRPDYDTENAGARLVDRDGFLVFTGTEPFDAVEVIMAARADRDDELSARGQDDRLRQFHPGGCPL